MQLTGRLEVAEHAQDGSILALSAAGPVPSTLSC